MQYIIILILFVILNACNKAEKVIDIPEKYYNIPVELNLNHKKSNLIYKGIKSSDTLNIKIDNVVNDYYEPVYRVNSLENRIIAVDYAIDVSAKNNIADKIYFKFLTKEERKRFKNSDIEILFSNTAANKDGFGVPINTLVSIRRINSKLQSFFISWYPKILNGLDYAINSSFLNENTDCVFSNLPFEIFNKRIYPIDSSHYTQIIEDTLNIDESYHQTELDFYRRIRTSKFKIGGNLVFDFQRKHEFLIEESKRQID